MNVIQTFAVGELDIAPPTEFVRDISSEDNVVGFKVPIKLNFVAL